ncbi:bleomycin hydrolase-like [Anoplophora glabripennis]|uniref:bleomycin hydrolase-like n=1 Tax=Anoplophora glabripennis TaxID=217634 RepID=UPI000C76D84D|nr:bleomycin hydrolase-like [Anoplophora glabripennis]
MDSRGTLTDEVLEGFRKMFYSQEKNVLARNVCSRTDPFDAAQSSDILDEMQPVFNHKVEPEGKPMTDQRGTGLCWLFSGLNLMRLPFMKEYNLEEFEFSQAHLVFWHKIEASNTFLYNMVKTAQNKEPLDGRLMTFLLRKPISDGGFWHILANLVNKHGLMPKKNFSEYYNSSYTSKMNDVLGSMLRQYAKAIRDLVAKGGCDEDIDNLIQDQMSNIYRVVGICLGIPSETFTWSYYDKDKAFKSIGPVTPKEFYEKHVKPFFNVDDKVCLVSDPRPTFEFGKLFTMDYINDVVGAKNCIFNNQPVELLLDLTAKSIKEGEAVLSSCELSRKYSSWRHGMHLKT